MSVKRLPKIDTILKDLTRWCRREEKKHGGEYRFVLTWEPKVPTTSKPKVKP